MKRIITVISFLSISSAAFAADARNLTQQEKMRFHTQACKAFARIYAGYVVVDQTYCANHSKFQIRENDERYGTYIFGTLRYNQSREKNCNMQIESGKIVSADCGDE